jgi:hypothetical protein
MILDRPAIGQESTRLCRRKRPGLALPGRSGSCGRAYSRLRGSSPRPPRRSAGLPLRPPCVCLLCHMPSSTSAGSPEAQSLAISENDRCITEARNVRLFRTRTKQVIVRQSLQTALNRNRCDMLLVCGDSKSRKELHDWKNGCHDSGGASFVGPGAGTNQSGNRSGCHFGSRCRHPHPPEFATVGTSRNSSPARYGARPEPVRARRGQAKRAREER